MSELPTQPTPPPSPTPSTATILYEVDRHVGTITLNRPEKMNALRFEEFEAIEKYLAEADLDPKVHVIRIKSNGERVFSAGLDTGMLSTIKQSDMPILLKHGNQTVRQILQVKKPIIVQVQGPAVGWGCISSLAADMIVVGDNPRTFFQLPEMDVGIYPATGALSMVLHNMPIKLAKRMLLLAQKMPISELENVGIIAAKYPLTTLDADCFKFCRELAKKSPSMLYLTKAVMNNIYFEKLEEFFRLEGGALELSKLDDKDKIDNFIKKIWSKIPPFDPQA